MQLLPRQRRAPRSSRRGVLLLVVLSLLVLFMLIGTAFLMSSNQYRNASTASAKVDRLGNYPTKILDRAVMQVLRDVGDPKSAVRYHSLLRDLYGSDGFQAVVYSPFTMDLTTTAGQVTRYAAATAGTNPLLVEPVEMGPTQGQLIDIYVRELAYKAVDPLTPTVTTVPSMPDARHVLKLEPGVNGVPDLYQMPLTKGYFNGCLLTITAGPASGQSTRIVDYEEIDLEPATPPEGGILPIATGASTNPFPPKPLTRLFRFRVMAFPRADGNPLAINPVAGRSPEIGDLAGATFIVNGRPFNGTGAGFNELTVAGQPRLNAREGIRLGTVAAPTPGSFEEEILNPEIALLPNAAFFFASDPLNDPSVANKDLWGARYLSPNGPLPLNPTNTNPATGGVAIANRPLLWKYQTFVGPGDSDESYDAPDFQNLALALQTVTPRARGRVVQGSPSNPVTLEVDSPAVSLNQFLRLDLEDLPLPSFFRPDLENYWFHRLVKYAIDVDSASADDAVRAVLAPYGYDGIRGNADDPSVSIDIRDQIVAVKRKVSLRPLREDHPNFDGSNPASRPLDLDGISGLMRGGNIAVPFHEAVGPWDVDNDNDGVADSVWVDLGEPVAQAEDGTLYKPLVAFLIVDLDSRLNVNAHGLVDDISPRQFFGDGIDNDGDGTTDEPGEPGDTASPMANFADSDILANGVGYGPAEISLRPILSPNLPGNVDATLAARIGNPAYDDYARILIGRPAFGAQPSVWGRHGSVNIRGDASIDWTINANAATEAAKVRPGIPYDVFSPATQTATLDRLSVFKFFGYPLWLSNYYGAFPTPSSFGTPPDLMGRYGLGLDHVGQPVGEPRQDAFVYGEHSLLFDSPYELNLSDPVRRDAPDPSIAATIKGAPTAAVNDDAPFATADLERILRAHDADAGALPDRLWNVVDAFDPLKLFANQPAAVLAQAQQLFNTTSPGDAELLAAAQQLAGVTRRQVTTDSYDLPTPGGSVLSRLVYGADGQPGKAGSDDNGNGILDDPSGDDDGNGVGNDATELGWMDSDDWYAVMNRGVAGAFAGSGAPTPLPGVRLAPDHPTIVDLLKYRIQYERWKKDPTLPIFTEIQLTGIVNQLLSPELLAGGKMDLNRPFGDGEDNVGNGLDDDGDGFIDATDLNGNGIIDGPDANSNGLIDEKEEVGTTDLRNGIVDDPFEAGEPFLDINGNGKCEFAAEPWIDVDADGEYDPPRDQLWVGLASESITFDYTNGQAVPIHLAGFGPIIGGVRNLNAQGRQLYARHLYCLMLLLMDENYLEMPDLPSLDGNNLNLELLLMKVAVDNGGSAFAATDIDKLQVRRKLTAQRIAQWAINCVDERDADSIMTPFEYDENPWDGWGCLDNATPVADIMNIPLDGDVATDENLGAIIDWTSVNPALGAGTPPTKNIINVPAPPIVPNQTRGVVWGAERPELLITETLAFHDRRCTDEPEFGSIATLPPAGATTDQRDYDLDQRLKPRGSLFVELYNPWTKDGNKPREFYGQVTTNLSEPTNSQGVMLNRLSDLADSVSGKYSPVWRMSVLREPLNGRMPVFKNLAKKLDSGVLNLTTGFPNPDPADEETLTADFLTIDPDGYNIDMDFNAERQVYFTTGRNYVNGTGSDSNRSDDDNVEFEPINPQSVGDWQFKDVSGVLLPNPVPVVNQIRVRVPPLSQPRQIVVAGVTYVVPQAKRYFIARNERVDNPTNPTPNDVDATIAPILPGRYAVIGSSGLQLVGAGASTSRAEDLQVAERFVTPVSRDVSQPEDLNGDKETFGRLPAMRRVELWPNPAGRPDIQQVLVAENGGQEFVRIDNINVINVTDPNRDGDPTNTPSAAMLIDSAIAIPIEDVNVSEPVEGYPNITYRKLYELNTPVNSTGLPIPLQDLSKPPRPAPSGELVYGTPYDLTAEGDLAYSTPYDRPLDTDFELVRNGTTQNYRSIHLQRLANPTLPWNPLPFDSAGNPNPLHRAWLPVNPYRTIDSQSVDLTAFNGASTLERTNLPGGGVAFSQDFVTDLLQSNILAPITATQFLDAPDHEIWAMILLMKLKGISIGNSPQELRIAGTTNISSIETPLSQLEAIESVARAQLTSMVQENVTPPQQPKFPNGMQEGWSWHMYRRLLPDDQLSGASLTGFRQWLHFKSLERGFHASNYFKYPKPGAFYAANPTATDIEGWAPDVSVLPRMLWKQERPNARLFLQGPTGIVDASDLKNVISRRVLSDTMLTNEERTKTIPDSEISRNRLIWNSLAASLTPSPQPLAVFDYVLEQTLGFANRSYTPDLERVDGEIASTMMNNPAQGAPEVATLSDRRPANPISDQKEIWNAQRQASKLATAPNPPTSQPSLLQAVVDAGTYPTLETDLVDEFYERRRLLTKSTYPWFAWNDRPLVSAEEMMQVPASSSSLMLRDFSLPDLFTPNPSVPVIAPPTPEESVALQIALQHAPFGHLLNVFMASLEPAKVVTNPLLPTGASNLYRILDYVEVPSRHVGTDTMLSPEIFNDVPTYIAATEPVGTDFTGLDDPRLLLQPPFNKVSRERDPGRVNLNTVTGRRRVESSGFVRHWSEVYDGIMHRYGDSNLLDATSNVLQLGHFGPAWRDVALSRRGYAQYVADPAESDPVEKMDLAQIQPETFAFGLNRDFPSVFSNPFRSADAGDVVPLSNMVRPGVDATWLRGHHWQRADDDMLITNPFASQSSNFDRIAWGIAGVDDDGNGIVDDVREAGFGTIDVPSGIDGDTLRIKPSANNALESSGIPLFSESLPEPAIDAERNPGMMYQPMTRLGNLVTTRSNVYAIWVTVGYFEVERAPDWNHPNAATRLSVRQRFGGTANDADDATVRARALYDRVYPEGYTLGEELGTDTGNTKRQRAFYIIDRTEPVGFKPGEDLNVDKMIRVRRRIE